MASNDRNNKLFWVNNEFPEFMSLGEGMNEFMASVIEDGKPKTYFWESFVAMMLIMSNNSTVKTFFEESSDNFINLFNEIDIKNIILNLYQTGIDFESESYEDTMNYKKCVREVLNALINIELANVKNIEALKRYREVFLDSLESYNLKNIFISNEYKNYHNYAKKLIDKKMGR